MQMNTKHNYARDNRVYVYANAEIMSREGCCDIRNFWRHINDLMDLGIIEIERPDFAFNDNQNCYAICFPFLKQYLEVGTFTPHAKRVAWKLTEIMERGPAYGLKTIPAYKKKVGKHVMRKGVQNHHRKRQRESFLDRLTSDSSPYDTTDFSQKTLIHCPYRVSFNHLISPTFSYVKYKNKERDYVGISGREIYEESREWLNEFSKNGGIVHWANPPTFVAKWIGKLIRDKSIGNHRELLEHAAYLAKVKWCRENVAIALSFRACRYFHGRHDRKKNWSLHPKSGTIEQVKADVMVFFTPEQKQSERTASEAFIANNPNEGDEYKQMRRFLLDKVGPTLYTDMLLTAPFVMPTDDSGGDGQRFIMRLKNNFQRDYLNAKFSFLVDQVTFRGPNE
jgi:hypothetical protein